MPIWENRERLLETRVTNVSQYSQLFSCRSVIPPSYWYVPHAAVWWWGWWSLPTPPPPPCFTSLSNNSSSILCVFSLCLPLFPVAGMQPFSHLFPSSFRFHMIFVLAVTPLSSPSWMHHEHAAVFLLRTFQSRLVRILPVRSSLQERNSLLTFSPLSREPRYRSQVEQRENSGIQEGSLEFLPTVVQTNKSDSETRNEAFDLK